MSERKRLRDDARLFNVASTKFHNFFTLPYAPRATPAGRLHVASLLKHALLEHQLEAWPIVEALRARFGSDETVWGFKWGEPAPHVEFYFYNRTRNAPGNPLSAAAVRETVKPWLEIAGEVNEAIPYTICSFEVSAEALKARQTTPFRLYTYNSDVKRWMRHAFSFRAERRDCNVLENSTWFCFTEDADDVRELRERIRTSPRDSGVGAERFLNAAALACPMIVHGVKPLYDALYFSGMSTAEMAAFLEEHDTTDMAGLLRAHEGDFDYASWDLGFDYRLAPTGLTLVLPKFAIFGVV